MAIYTCVPAHIQHVAATLLKDNIWLDNVYFPTNIKRLRTAYEKSVSRLENIGVKVLPAKVEYFT